jgi:hypothetical protein
MMQPATSSSFSSYLSLISSYDEDGGVSFLTAGGAVLFGLFFLFGAPVYNDTGFFFFVGEGGSTSTSDSTSVADSFLFFLLRQHRSLRFIWWSMINFN